MTEQEMRAIHSFEMMELRAKYNNLLLQIKPLLLDAIDSIEIRDELPIHRADEIAISRINNVLNLIKL